MGVVADKPPGAGNCAGALSHIASDAMLDLDGDLLLQCAEEGLPGSIEELHRRSPEVAAELIDMIRAYPEFSPPGLADRLAARIAAI